MARAVVLTPRIPWPLDDGGLIALWQSLWSTAQRFDVTLLSMVRKGTENDEIPRKIQDLGVEVIRIPHSPPSLPVAAWRGIAGRWPYTLTRYRNTAYESRLRQIVREQRPDFIFGNHLHLATYMDIADGVPWVLREQNLEYLWMMRYAQTLRPGPKKLYAQIQAGRLRAAESELCSRASLVFAIQDDEVERIRHIAPRANVACLPIGVDPANYRKSQPKTPPVILLAGNFGWPPNGHGALRFIRDGWPMIQASYPNAKLRLAGKDPSPEVVQAARSVDAEVAGYVSSMIDEFVDATMLVVPLWSGAGARAKTVEALMCQLPVVSTSVGAEGMGMTPGEHLLIADTPEDLGKHVVDLLGSPQKMEKLGSKGHQFALENWSMEAVAKVQNRYCESILKG